MSWVITQAQKQELKLMAAVRVESSMTMHMLDSDLQEGANYCTAADRSAGALDLKQPCACMASVLDIDSVQGGKVVDMQY